MGFKYVNNIFRPIVKPEYIINRSQILFENARTGSDRLLQEEGYYYYYYYCYYYYYAFYCTHLTMK